MMKYLIITLILLNSITVTGQNKTHIRQLFEGYKEVFPKMKLSDEQTIYWLKKYNIATHENEKTDSSDLFNLSFIDLNHDTFPDVVEVTDVGVVPLHIFLGTKDSMKLILNKWESVLSDIKYSNNKVELVIQSLGMVDPYQEESIYEFINDTLLLSESREMRLCTSQPQDYYTSPKYVQTLNCLTALRENPRISKGECFPEDGTDDYNKQNNIIFKYPIHTKGRIWGESHNAIGEKWVLAELLIQDENGAHFYRIGWIKPEDVEEIK